MIKKRIAKEHKEQPNLPTFGFMRLTQVLAVYPIGKSTLWAWIKQGRFPKPVKLGPRITAWRIQDIRALLERE
jgi:prophage regulatory protein